MTPSPQAVKPLITPVPDTEITINTQTLQDLLRDKFRTLEFEFETKLKDWQKDVMESVQTEIQQFKTDIRFLQSRYFQSDFNHRFRACSIIEDEIAMHEEEIGAMLRLDTIHAQWPAYEEELDDLERSC